MKKNLRFKPSPAYRKFSRVFSGIFALIGLGFVVLGVTEVIPSGAGVFGFVWTGMALCFVGLGIYGAVSKDGLFRLYGFEIEEEEEQGESAQERLEKLQELYDQRLITAEEYEEKRKEILKEL